mmetsp:Transcript_4425/g.12793  ORF Transcript_4425/g.12793 Transcript_4425/m.12793 type:complete len:293 (+) Transcript_4425:171-1049(+)
MWHRCSRPKRWAPSSHTARWVLANRGIWGATWRNLALTRGRKLPQSTRSRRPGCEKTISATASTRPGVSDLTSIWIGTPGNSLRTSDKSGTWTHAQLATAPRPQPLLPPPRQPLPSPLPAPPLLHPLPALPPVPPPLLRPAAATGLWRMFDAAAAAAEHGRSTGNSLYRSLSTVRPRYTCPNSLARSLSCSTTTCPSAVICTSSSRRSALACPCAAALNASIEFSGGNVSAASPPPHAEPSLPPPPLRETPSPRLPPPPSAPPGKAPWPMAQLPPPASGPPCGALLGGVAAP